MREDSSNLGGGVELANPFSAASNPDLSITGLLSCLLYHSKFQQKSLSLLQHAGVALKHLNLVDLVDRPTLPNLTKITKCYQC